MTLTINVPDESVARFQAAADARGQDMPTFLIDAANAVVDAAEDFEPDPDAVEGIRLGIKAIADGDIMSFESYEAEVMAERRQRAAAVG